MPLANTNLPGQEPGAPFDGQKPLDPVAARAAETAMAPDRFWELIAVLNGSTEAEDLEQLIAALAQSPIDDIVAFHRRLIVTLYELDYRARYDWRVAHDPSGMDHLGDDGFLYARADTIAAGREAYDHAITHGTLPWGSVDPESGGGESLLYAAVEASERIGAFERFERGVADLPIGYETGSNPAGGW